MSSIGFSGDLSFSSNDYSSFDVAPIELIFFDEYVPPTPAVVSNEPLTAFADYLIRRASRVSNALVVQETGLVRNAFVSSNTLTPKLFTLDYWGIAGGGVATATQKQWIGATGQFLNQDIRNQTYLADPRQTISLGSNEFEGEFLALTGDETHLYSSVIGTSAYVPKFDVFTNRRFTGLSSRYHLIIQSGLTTLRFIVRGHGTNTMSVLLENNNSVLFSVTAGSSNQNVASFVFRNRLAVVFNGSLYLFDAIALGGTIPTTMTPSITPFPAYYCERMFFADSKWFMLGLPTASTTIQTGYPSDELTVYEIDYNVVTTPVLLFIPTLVTARGQIKIAENCNRTVAQIPHSNVVMFGGSFSNVAFDAGLTAIVPSINYIEGGLNVFDQPFYVSSTFTNAKQSRIMTMCIRVNDNVLSPDAIAPTLLMVDLLYQ